MPGNDALSEEDQAFMELADEFIQVGNLALGAESAARVAAAFLYACSRYNAFAMQWGGLTPTEVDEDTVAYLEGDFRAKLCEHMAQRVVDAPEGEAGADAPASPVIDILSDLEASDSEERGEFLDLADRFITKANDLISRWRASRVSAACSFGCARFLVFVMQTNGLRPTHVDEACAETVAQTYGSLVRRHMGEMLIEANA